MLHLADQHVIISRSERVMQLLAYQTPAKMKAFQSIGHFVYVHEEEDRAKHPIGALQPQLEEEVAIHSNTLTV